MQEHIRRAHPSHYIPKLPATEESFLLMVNTATAAAADQRPQFSPPDPVQSRPSHNGPSCGLIASCCLVGRNKYLKNIKSKKLASTDSSRCR